MRSQSFRRVPSTKNNRDMKNLAGMVWIALLMACAMGMAQAQTYSIVASFNGTDGDLPATSPVQGVDGNFYGTTAIGGGSDAGNAYRVTPTGELTSIYIFCSLPNCVDGNQPQSAMVLNPDGNFYGTTSAGGANLGSCFGPGCGTVFRLTPAGKLTTLYSFCPVANCLDGSVPLAALVLGGDGNFYGTTYNGGQNGRGTVFKISPSGKFQRLYSFCKLANCVDGSYPVTALIQGRNGNFYGTTYDGGSVNCTFFGGTYGCGTIFEITAAGTLTTLYSFGTNAGLLQAPVVQGSNGNLYGTSTNGGTGLCNYGCGTVFELTPAGSYSALYNFCTKEFCPDGAYPMAGLLQATDGSMYGTTTTGGTGVGEGGTLFAMKPSGALHTVYGFGGTPTGYEPEGTLLQATDGNFYGVTWGGGAENQGVVYQVAIGLGPYVQTVPTSGKTGTHVIILGNHLTGATAVTFNGTVSSFKVLSGTEITATVPSGATSGAVMVTVGGQTLKSNPGFQVLP